jgi:hypothetical protein
MIARRFFASVVPLLAMAGSALATGSDIAEASDCSLSAWSTATGADADVHAGPASGSPVIARLPPPVPGYDETFATEVSITGAKHGWFRIDGASTDDYVTDTGPASVFEGSGWVSGQALALLLNDARLHRAPSMDAPVVATLAGIDDEGLHNGPDSFVVERLLDCTGDWVEVEGSFLGKRLHGWATHTCASQVTTCP